MGNSKHSVNVNKNKDFWKGVFYQRNRWQWAFFSFQIHFWYFPLQEILSEVKKLFRCKRTLPIAELDKDLLIRKPKLVWIWGLRSWLPFSPPGSSLLASWRLKTCGRGGTWEFRRGMTSDHWKQVFKELELIVKLWSHYFRLLKLKFISHLLQSGHIFLHNDGTDGNLRN